MTYVYSYTLSSLYGYEAGKRYKKHLTFVTMNGNSNNKQIIMKDEDGTLLQWNTTTRTKTYQNFRTSGVYTFRIDHIMEPTSKIYISHLKVVE